MTDSRKSAFFIRLIFMFIGFFSLLPLHVQAQVDVLLNIPSPNTPFLSEWKENPAIGSILLINRSGREKNVQYEVIINHERYGQVFKAKTVDQDLAVSGERISNQNVANFTWTNDTWDFDFENLIFRTGRLPEGTYTITIKVHETREVIAIQTIEIEIVYPDPPQLLQPPDEFPVNVFNPIFLWTPCVIPPRFEVSYELKIVPVLSGQVPLRALMANIPQLETSLFSTNFPYPIDGLPFEDGQEYAWRVRALDENGLPIASNRGFSEIFTFTYELPAIPSGPVSILTNALIMTGQRPVQEGIHITTDALIMTGQRLQPISIITDALIMTGQRPVQEEIHITTDALIMTGQRLQPISIITDALIMTGQRPVQEEIHITTDALIMTGQRLQPFSIITDALIMTGQRRIQEEIHITTDALIMTGERPQPLFITTDALIMTGKRSQPLNITTDALVMTGKRPQPLAITTDALIMTGKRPQPIQIKTDKLIMTGKRSAFPKR